MELLGFIREGQERLLQPSSLPYFSSTEGDSLLSLCSLAFFFFFFFFKPATLPTTVVVVVVAYVVVVVVVVVPTT